MKQSDAIYLGFIFEIKNKQTCHSIKDVYFTYVCVACNAHR